MSEKIQNQSFSNTHRGLLQKALSFEREEKKEVSIVEKDGIYSVSRNIETSSVVLNPEFKELVDSVLNTTARN